MRCPYDIAHIAGVRASKRFCKRAKAVHILPRLCTPYVRTDSAMSFATLLVLLAEAREAPILLVGLFNGR